MAPTRKKLQTQLTTRVSEDFESIIRLCEGVPSSRGTRASDLEVQHLAPEARVSVAVDIHLWSESHFFCGLSGDIAEGGLFISTYLPFPVGSFVEVEFTLPGTDDTVSVLGAVRWVREHSNHEPRGVGIAFEELSAIDRDRIQEFCIVRPALYYDDVG